ncbi:MAG: MFS transporter [Flavobacteriales bacterium]
MGIESNIWKLYVIKGLRWFMLIMPIVVLFFQENGLSLREVMILQGSYSFMVALMEIPSGYIADVFGRKKTLILGAVTSFIGFLIISLSFNFWPFLLGEIFLGLGASFISGADSALLYDSLVESKREKEYTKVEGTTYGIGNFSEAIAGICGGFLADISLRLPWYFQLIIAALIIPITLTLVEPTVHQKNRLQTSLKAIWEVVKFTLIENKYLRWIILLSSSIGLATLTIAWFAQPYFKSIDLPLKYFGIAWAILNLSTGISSINAYRIENILNKKTILLSISILVSLPVVLINSYGGFIGLSLLLFIYLIRGFATPLLRNYINEKTDSTIRATVLSIRSFCIRLAFAIFAPFLGWIADIYTLQHSFVVLGLVILFFSLLFSLKLSKLMND